jgi:salicylate hydroxylase
MPGKVCIIVGGGISGPVAALVLSRIGIKCTIYELRDAPATIGGAINLTPNALRLLEDLGVAVSGCVVDAIELFSYHTGSRLGEVSFRGRSGHALRVVRSKLHEALLEAVKRAGVPVEYGHKLASIDDDPARKVVAHFENGGSAEGDFILGCDGTYSAVRLKYVEPGRVPIYTGASTAYSIVDATGITAPIHFSQTGLNSGRYGSLLTSYVDPGREKVYLAAVMETPEQGSKEGWRARGMDYEKTSQEIKRRYWNSAFPCIRELLEKVEEWTFYPVCRLGPRGKWTRGRVILLGDSAHGVCIFTQDRGFKTD